LIIKRFIFGLGSVSNLNDAYPWGFWIGFDVLTGIALAAGGFTLTAAIYIWGAEKYHSLARPAILTAFLGYVFFVIALVIDLGRGPVMWHMFLPWLWQHNSVMFEVGWCVGTYLTILFLEFMPCVMEKYQWTSLANLWRKFSGPLVVLLLTLFTYAMTSSVYWAVGVLLLATLCGVLQLGNTTNRHKNVPILLIIGGIVSSCMHQSSLGSLYLPMPNKLHPIWYTPVLSFIFLASAIMVGPAMVIFEGIVSAKIFKRQPETAILSGLAGALPIILIIYLLLRISDLLVRGVVPMAFEPNMISVMFWVEMVVGTFIPLLLLSNPKINRSPTGMFWGSLCIIVGLFVHRFNVTSPPVNGIVQRRREQRRYKVRILTGNNIKISICPVDFHVCLT